ncbi:hypothetical protein EDB85DRAFT_1892582 [Lactarius pseudohatsudake]|nr:hypothetical protein EDB85DRAFT_1892579 [Lactarius pseudohatsudake]KAH9028288.1 hypothetical protein EDB85DRAFT_1892582 [Lactarius pseudohatsudake]
MVTVMVVCVFANGVARGGGSGCGRVRHGGGVACMPADGHVGWSVCYSGCGESSKRQWGRSACNGGGCGSGSSKRSVRRGKKTKKVYEHRTVMHPKHLEADFWDNGTTMRRGGDEWGGGPEDDGHVGDDRDEGVVHNASKDKEGWERALRVHFLLPIGLIVRLPLVEEVALRHLRLVDRALVPLVTTCLTRPRCMWPLAFLVAHYTMQPLKRKRNEELPTAPQKHIKLPPSVNPEPIVVCATPSPPPPPPSPSLPPLQDQEVRVESACVCSICERARKKEEGFERGNIE